MQPPSPKAPSPRSLELYHVLVPSLTSNREVLTVISPDGAYQVNVLAAPDRPNDGDVLYTTLSLGDDPVTIGDNQVRTEIYVAAHGRPEGLVGTLAMGAWNIAVRRFHVAPGISFRNVVAPTTAPNLPHLLFTNPMDFGEHLARVQLDGGDTFFLQAMPISEAEDRFCKEHGFDALEQRFMAAGLDYADLSRESVIPAT